MVQRWSGAGRALLLLALLIAAHEAAAAADAAAAAAAAAPPSPPPPNASDPKVILQTAVRYWTVRSRLRQAAFCHALYPEDLKNVQALVVKTSPYDSPTFYVYSFGDPVSDTLRSGRGWKVHEMEQLLWAMRQQVPQHIDGAKVFMGAGSDLFLDVGAHVGWFTINVAVSGYRVAAFDALLFNRRLLRSTLCNNSQLMDRVTLYPVGLGERSAKCFIMSSEANKGDGILDCESKNVVAAEKLLPQGYTLRGDAQVERLDRLVPLQDVKAIKIDVEGYELMVLNGAQDLFKRRKVWFMILEFNSVLIRTRLKGGDPKDLLRHIIGLGFKISPSSFKGPFINEASNAQLDMLEEVGKSTLSLFCVNALMFEHFPEFKANTSMYRTAGEISAKPKPAA